MCYEIPFIKFYILIQFDDNMLDDSLTNKKKNVEFYVYMHEIFYIF